MKRFLQKLISFLAATVLSVCVFGALSACDTGGGKVTATLVYSDKDGDNTIVVIRVDETDGKGNVFNAMEYLKARGELSFEYSTGSYGAYITELNGKTDSYTGETSGYSWMLYTSDDDYENPDAGTVEYGGETYGQASKGASYVTVKAGEYYIWYYTAWSY